MPAPVALLMVAMGLPDASAADRSALLYGGLDFALVWTPLQSFKFTSTQNVTEPSSVQAILEPKVGARFGMVAPSVSYMAPLGGRLGHTGIGGLRLHVDACF